MAIAPGPSLPDSVSAPRTAMFGRDIEIAAARGFLLDQGVPLLTLTGPGGVGKTRLAIAVAQDVARHFADGAVFVDLARVTHPAHVADAVAAALGLKISGERPAAAVIGHHLRRGQQLLVLDNCEHVLAAAGDLVSELLAACPALQVLATSRAALRIRGEQIVPVPPLPVAAFGGTREGEEPAPAIALFADRARAAAPDFALSPRNRAAVTELCRKLDGLPLAIELAAGRANLLSPAVMLGLLDRQQSVLGTGPRDGPARHRSLDDAIAWSYALLTPEDQAFFRGLSIFVGGWTLDAAAAVGGFTLPKALTRLESLAGQSLIVRRSDSDASEARFAMLETIRAFALKQAAGDADGARRNHAVYFLDLAERAARELVKDDPYWWDHLEYHRANFDQALAWFESQHEADAMLRLAIALERFWIPHGHLQEGRAWFERALALAPHHPHRGSALFAVGMIAHLQGDIAQSIAWATEGLTEAAAREQPRGKMLYLLGINAQQQEQINEASRLLEEAIVHLRHEDDPPWLAWALADFAAMLLLSGTIPERGERLAAEGLALHRILGNDLGAGVLLAQLGMAALLRGKTQLAAEHFHSGLATLEAVGDTWWLVIPLQGSAEIASKMADWRIAARFLGAADRIMERTGPVSIVPDVRQRERALRAEVIRALGEADFALEWQAGHSCDGSEVLAVANTLLASALAGTRDGLTSFASGTPRGAMTVGSDLTPRERDVLRLLCQHYTDAEIADFLFISPRTANRHVSGILRKLGAANRREASALAARHGLG